MRSGCTHASVTPELVKGGFILVGSSQTVSEQLQRWSRELGFGSLNAQLTFGSLTHYNAVKSMELFATEVMPRLRPETGRRADGA